MKKASESIRWEGLERLPQALKDCPQWVLWKYGRKDNKTGKFPKIPCNGSGVSINIHTRTNKKTGGTNWKPFTEVYQSAQEKGYGIGFYPGNEKKGPGLVFLDVDNMGDDMAAIAAAIIEQLGEDTYKEKSPSGKGLHFVIRVNHRELIQGRKPNFLLNDKRIGVEVYGYGQFCTVTGDSYGEPADLCSAAAGDRFLKWLYEQDKSLDTHTAAGPRKYDLPADVNAMVDDGAILETLQTVQPLDLEKPGIADLAIISDLNCYLENKTFADDSGSAKDQAAMDFLAVATDGRPGDMLRLFFQAGYSRDKWTDPKHFDHYAVPTMHKAIGLYYLQSGEGLTEDTVSALTCEDLNPELVQRIQAIKDRGHREAVRQLVEEQAGRLQKKTDFKKLYQEEQEQREQAAREGRETRFPKQPKTLLSGEYICDDRGVRRVRVVSGAEKLEVISPIPFMPTALYENVEDGTEKVDLSYYKGGKWKTITVSRSTVANKNRIINLAGMGPEVTTTTATGMVNYLADMINRNVDNGGDEKHSLQRRASISHLGWTAGGEFAPYSKVIHLDIEEQERQLVEAVQPRGELKTWLAIVSPLLNVLAIRMAIAASLASPIVGYLKGLPFVFHLWGPTGVGKSVALKVAASVWGCPLEGGGLVDSLNNTINYIMGKAAILHSIPFFGDELQTIKAEDYDRLIYRLSEGISRGRMKSDGSREQQRRWYNVSLFTGEDPVTQSSSGGGAENRTVEMELAAPIMDPLQVGPLLAKISACYGVVGPVFVQRIKDKEEDLKARIRVYQNDLISKPYGATDKQALNLATMLAAYDLFCEIAQHEGVDVPGIALDEVRPIVKTLEDVDTAEKAFRYTVDRIMMNRNNFYICPFLPQPQGIQAAPAPDMFNSPRGECWGSIDKDVKGFDREIKIYKAALERILAEKGFRLKAVQSEWAARKYLVKKYGRFYHTDTVNGQRGNVYTIVLPAAEQGSRGE